MEKAGKGALPKTVGEYLALQPEPVRQMLEELRQTIKAAAPQAEEVISYQMPGYKYKGPVVYFAAWPRHCSLYAVSKPLLKHFSKELEPFKKNNTTIHFTVANPLPKDLIEKIVKMRLEANEALATTKKKP